MGALCAVLFVLTMGNVAAAAFLIASYVAGGIRFADLRRVVMELRRQSRLLVRRVLDHPRARDLLEKRRERKRLAAVRAGMPEAIRLLCISLASGSSLIRALEYAAANTTGPLGEELRRVVWDLQAGQGFAEAMENLRARTGGSEFAYLAVAMEIQYAAGGSLGAVLESVSDSLRQAVELEEELYAKTAQARLSARLVCLMPIALLAVLTLLSPGYISPFFSSAFGVVIFIAGILMEVGGVLLVRRCLAVDLTSGLGAGT